MPPMNRRILGVLVLAIGCQRKQPTEADRDAEAQADAAHVKQAADQADAEAKYVVALDAWSVKTRKACGLKPDAVIFPATKRRMLEDCNAKVASGLPDSKFPPLPLDTDRTGLSSVDGCRYFVDSYVDTQGVRAKFRCKYDPSMLGRAEWEMLR